MKVMKMAKLFRLLFPRICTLIFFSVILMNTEQENKSVKSKDGKDVIYDRSSVC